MIRVAIAALLLGLALSASAPAATPCPSDEPCDPAHALAPQQSSTSGTASAASASATPATNVRGTLAKRPRAACPTAEPCDPPQAGAFVLFSRSAKPTVRVRVSGGAFAVHLAAGAYTIKLAPPPQSGHVSPAAVRVPRTGVVRLQLVVQPKA